MVVFVLTIVDTGRSKTVTVVFAVKVKSTADSTIVVACTVEDRISMLVEVVVENVGPVGNEVSVVREVKEKMSVTVNVMGCINVVTVE